MKTFLKKYRFKIIFIIFAVIIITVIFALFSIDNSANGKNLEYIQSYGWEVDDVPVEISHISLPESLNILYAKYGDTASASGKTLKDYCGKSVTRYSYNVLNHTDSESKTVRASVIVYKDEIIAADISTLQPDGTTVPITDTSNMK